MKEHEAIAEAVSFCELYDTLSEAQAKCQCQCEKSHPSTIHYSCCWGNCTGNQCIICGKFEVVS